MPITTPIATSCTIPLRTSGRAYSKSWRSWERTAPWLSWPDESARRAARFRPPSSRVDGRFDAPAQRRSTARGASRSSSPSAGTCTSRVRSSNGSPATPRTRSPRSPRCSRSADIAVVNLETAVTNGGTPTAKEFTFRAPATAFAALRGGGRRRRVHGEQPRPRLRRRRAPRLARGREAVPLPGHRHRSRRRAGLPSVPPHGQRPADRRHRRDAGSGRRAHLGVDRRARASPGSHRPRTFRGSLRAVRAARATSDTVVVFLHWGVELQQCPSPDQRTLARQLVAAGADIVVGGHAHRVQGAGRMGNALVGYGLGNFVWYGTSELSTQTGVLVVTVDGKTRPRVPLGARPDRRRGAASADGFGSLDASSRPGARCAAAPA